MWTALMLLCLIASFDVDAGKLSTEDSSELRLEDAELPAARLLRKFRPNSHTRRLHIENQTGFDGKVERIHINSEEDLHGIRAYGMPKKILASNGRIDRMSQADDVEGMHDFGPRALRAVEAYGMSKEHLETNGEIERVPVPSSYQIRRGTGARVSRSIDLEPKQDIEEESLNGELEDLEAQDAKVFRPLFVYRQQLAKKQHRYKDHPNYDYRSFRTPYYERRPFY
ncbi:uncharacterized protein LOC122395100 [Colletes gigas]|uniref:uncharacterized protein LOC122395100 n=1 Tax=Colletes gigas TaxID=935657 RepID=UPI001C9B2BBB|nr:uncharacterized protein LOC122395100 [Colletes gigas]